MSKRRGDPRVDLERRRISGMAALALLGGATVTLTACGGGGGAPGAPTAPPGGSSPPGASCPPGARCGTVEGDPNHSATITSAQLAAGGAMDLDIQGSSSHGHLVSLSAAEVAEIRDGRQVRKVSSENFAHAHHVVFN